MSAPPCSKVISSSTAPRAASLERARVAAHRPLLNDDALVRIHGGVQAEENVVEFPPRAEAPETPASFDDLFLDLHDRLYRALFFVTGSAHDAEELTQDAFLKLWERWDRIDTIEDPTAYLFRVAMNGFRMRTRRTRLAARKLIPRR